MGKNIKEKALWEGKDQYSLELSAKTSQELWSLTMFFGAKKKGEWECREHEGGAKSAQERRTTWNFMWFDLMV